MEITKDIRYIGVDDHDIDLFEGQYDVSENGMAYNSYVILGEKIAVADSVDGGFVDEWLGNLEAALDGRTPDYLVVHHMEPDHSAGIAAFMEAIATSSCLSDGSRVVILCMRSPGVESTLVSTFWCRPA